jgi:hypothetical protein
VESFLWLGNDKPIAQVSVADGMTIRLGNSGPKIRIRVGATNVQPSPKTRPPQRELTDKKAEVSQDKSTAWSGPRRIMEDDDGALTHIDFE